MAAIAHGRFGDSGGEDVFDPVEMLQTIRRENAQLARHGERSGSVTWETLYGNMKTLYDYEKTQPSHYKRMIRQQCMWAKIKMLEHTKSYKALVGCYIFRDIGSGASERDLGYHFPADLRAPQGRNWVQGGQTEVDDRYNHEGDKRRWWDEVGEFEDTHQVVAWSPEHEANRDILPQYWYHRGAFEHGTYLPGDAHPELNAPYGGHGEASVVSAEATPIESIGGSSDIPLATEVRQIEAGGGGGESKALVAHRAPPRVSASAFATDEEEEEARRLHIQPHRPNLPQGGGRKRRKKTRRKKKRKTKRLRRKKRKTKRRRKKKRTRRKR